MDSCHASTSCGIKVSVFCPGAKQILCDNLKSYADACMSEDVKVNPQWRMITKCCKLPRNIWFLWSAITCHAGRLWGVGQCRATTKAVSDLKSCVYSPWKRRTAQPSIKWATAGFYSGGGLRIEASVILCFLHYLIHNNWFKVFFNSGSYINSCEVLVALFPGCFKIISDQAERLLTMSWLW